jgi:hypothetical protein
MQSALRISPTPPVGRRLRQLFNFVRKLHCLTARSRAKRSRSLNDLPGRELNLPEMRLFNKHESHFSTETLLVCHIIVARGPGGALNVPFHVRESTTRTAEQSRRRGG